MKHRIEKLVDSVAPVTLFCAILGFLVGLWGSLMVNMGEKSCEPVALVGFGVLATSMVVFVVLFAAMIASQ